MKSIKRKLALLLAAMLICAFPIPALAAGEIEIDLSATPPTVAPDNGGATVTDATMTITIATETTVKIIGAGYQSPGYRIVSGSGLNLSDTVTLYIESGTPTQLESINVGCNLVITGAAGAQLIVATDTDDVNAIDVAGNLTINGNIEVYASSYASSGLNGVGISANNLVIDGGANVEGQSYLSYGVQLSGALFMNDGVLVARSNILYPTYSIGMLVNSVYDVIDESIDDGINVATFRPRVPRIEHIEPMRENGYFTQYITQYHTSERIEWITVYARQYSVNAKSSTSPFGTFGEAQVKEWVAENSPNSTSCFAIVKTEEGLSFISRPTLSKLEDRKAYQMIWRLARQAFLAKPSMPNTLKR